MQFTHVCCLPPGLVVGSGVIESCVLLYIAAMAAEAAAYQFLGMFGGSGAESDTRHSQKRENSRGKQTRTRMEAGTPRKEQ